MPLKIGSTDVANERGIIDSKYNSYQTKPTSITHQNLLVAPSGSQQFGGGANTTRQDTGVYISGGKLFVPDPEHDNSGELYVYNIEKDLIPLMTGSNATINISDRSGLMRYNIINTNQEVYKVMGVGHGRVVTAPDSNNDGSYITLICQLAHTNYDSISDQGPLNSTFDQPVSYSGTNTSVLWSISLGLSWSDGIYTGDKILNAICIGNGRVYVVWGAAEVGADPDVRWYLSILNIEDGSTIDTITIDTKANDVGYTNQYTDVHAKHGFVLIAEDGDDALLYTADGMYLDSLEGSSYKCRIGCGRFVVTQKATSTKFKLWNYARKLIASPSGSNATKSCDIGEELIVIGEKTGDPTTGVGTISNGGIWEVYDLDGNLRTDYGQSGNFWAFGLVSSSDNFGASVAIGDGIMAIGGPNYLDNDRSGNSNLRRGGVVVFKIPTTVGNHYDNILETYRY